MEVQGLQIGEVAQFRRDAARQSVVVEVQGLQIGEVAQFFRDAARQSVDHNRTAIAPSPTALDVQLCHMRARDSDAFPLTDGT